MSGGKRCELLEPPDRTISSQAQKWEGSTTIPKGSRIKRSEAHRTPQG
jgi:hypothetical protein